MPGAGGAAGFAADPAGRTADPLGTVDAFAAVLCRCGHDLVVAAGAFGTVVLGVLVQAGAAGDVGGALGPVRLALLAGVAGGVLRGVSLLILTGGRLLHPVSRLRRITAAPAKEGWRPFLGKPPEPSRAQLVEHVRLLVAAAHDRRDLAHGALLWAGASVAGLVLWTLLNIISGAGR